MVSRGSHNHVPPLTVVGEGSTDSEGNAPTSGTGSSGYAPVGEQGWSVLMARAQNGDSNAYRHLLEEITPYLRSLARKRHRTSHDAEDSVQDVLLTVHAIRHTYDPHRPFGPWLVAIANRRIIDRLRRDSRLKSRETVLDDWQETFPAPPTNFHQVTLDERTLRAAVEHLPPGQRQAIKLVKLKELSLKEAAAVSGVSVASLKVATHRALKNLRRILGSRDC